MPRDRILGSRPWDFLTGSILQLRITPGRASDATNPIAQEVAPAGSLSLFDLGYFCLDRFQNLTRAGAFWISRLQHGTSVFDAQGQPLALLQYLRQQTGSGPIDVSVLLGVSHRLPCRLIALRVPQEVADRRRQKAYVKAQKHGRVPSREYLEWQDWTIFVTNCEPELLTWEAVVVLYRRGGRSNLCSNSGSRTTGSRHTAPARPRRSNWRWSTSS